MKSKYLIISLLIITISGCSTPPQYMAMSTEHRRQIKSSKCIVLKKQKDLKADYIRSGEAAGAAAAGGGFLVVLISGIAAGAADTYRANKAEKNVAVIRKELKDYSVEEKLKKDMEPILKKLAWLNVERVEIVESYDKKSELDLINKAAHGTDVIVIMKPDYSLSHNFKDLTMKVDLDIYPASGQLKLTSKKNSDGSLWPIYSTKVEYIKHLKHESASSFSEEKNVILWSENNGDRIKMALNDGIAASITSVEKQLANPEVVTKTK